jgi:alkanesulfonate monooxygenase SsuD/methylene tetrahydromethanopterin reductase-like flavin-dependent oxidoreductase (luciferase family)
VTFEGIWDQVTAAGLAPMPVQQPIPVWFGGQSERAYVRAGQLADGWFPQVPPGPKLDAALEVINGAAREAGRDPAAIGMEGRVSWSDEGAGKLVSDIGRWRDAGATHVTINTMRAGLESVEGHLAALASAASALDLRQG